MTDKEKRTLKDGVKNLIGKYKVLEHGIIEVLENNILSFIDSMQEEPVNYNKLNTMLNDALLKETKESWNEKLGKEEPVSVWHDASEEPEEGKDFAFVTYNGIMWARYRIEDIFIEWQKYRVQTELDKWAYVSDLLKL